MAKKNAPTAPQLPLALWRELHQAAARFHLLAPWRWMDDTHVFGANNEHGVRLITVLGGMGEVFGMACYRGSAGANFLLRLRRGEFSPEGSDARFYQDALLVDFVPGKDLRKEDRAVMQQIGFQPPAVKPKLFPEFQSHKPGFVPWFIDEAEGRLLLEDLRNVVRFGELLRGNPSLFDPRQEDEFPFFPAAVSEPLTLAQLEWHIISPVAPPADPPVDPRAFELPALLALPQPAKAVWELAAYYAPLPIGEPPRPYFPKIALTVDAATGMVLAFQLAAPGQNMAQGAALSLVQCMTKSGCRPAAIRVDSINLTLALKPLADALGAKILQVKSLPMLNEARQALDAFGRQH